MPVVNFDTLPELWATMADMWSGRSTPTLPGGKLSDQWQGPDVQVSNTQVVVTMTAGGVTYVLQTLRPGSDLASCHAIIEDLKWRRAVVVSSTVPGGNGIDPTLVLTLRAQILSALWAQWLKTAEISQGNLSSFMQRRYITGQAPNNAGAGIIWTLTQQLTVMADWSTLGVFGQNNENTWTLTGDSPQAVDLVSCWSASYSYAYGEASATPQNPADLEGPAAAEQFNSFSGPPLGINDVLALHALADAIRAYASSTGGQAVTSDDRLLLKIAGADGPLPARAWTKDSALYRLAAACQLLQGGEMTLLDRRGNAVGLNSGVLVRRERKP